MCAVLGAQRASEEHRQLAGPVYLNPEDVARYASHWPALTVCMYPPFLTDHV